MAVYCPLRKNRTPLRDLLLGQVISNGLAGLEERERGGEREREREKKKKRKEGKKENTLRRYRVVKFLHQQLPGYFLLLLYFTFIFHPLLLSFVSNVSATVLGLLYVFASRTRIDLHGAEGLRLSPT